MKVLILGLSARSHALARACLKSPLLTQLVVAPGNDGIAQETECHPLDMNNLDAVVQFVLNFKPDLVIIAPEGLAALGLVDVLRSQDICVYGPTQNLMELQNSQLYSRNFMHKYGIPTASFAQFDNLEETLNCLKGERFPTVIKSDITQGGNPTVILANDYKQAEDAVRLIHSSSQLSGKKANILIEEYLKGEDIAINLMVCGEKSVTLPLAHDYNHLYEGDTGPLTFGMGAYAPLAWVPASTQELIHRSIIEPTLYGFKHEGYEYRGSLQIKVILTAQGPKAIDFKVALGDPACQTLLPLFASDALEAFLACAKGTLDPSSVVFNTKTSVTIIKNAQGYPFAFNTGEPITFPSEIPSHLSILHGATKKKADGSFITDGGRVLHINALGPSLVEAALAAYTFCQKVHFPSEFYRKDIGLKIIEQTK